MSEANKAVVRRFVEEIVNRWNPGLLPELVAAGHVDHWPDGDLYGPEGARIGIAEYRAAFADLSVTIEDLIAEGDRVAYRFTLRGTHTGPFLAVPATGRRVTATGIGIGRLAGGKLVESWINLDVLGLLRQLGAVGAGQPAHGETPCRSPNGRLASRGRGDRQPYPAADHGNPPATDRAVRPAGPNT